MPDRLLKTPVTLLTGFLGSGKTTLLSRLLTDPALANAVIIVNEFGEVSIDHLIVAQVAERIVELRNGCLCCTIRGDLVMTLRDLFNQRQLGDIPPFTRVIVETSGLADPIPLLHTLMANAPLMQAYALEAVVTVVDGLNGPATVTAHASASSQLALADVVVVSKADIATAEELAAAHALVDRINPAARRMQAVQGEVAALQIFDSGPFMPARQEGRISDWIAAHAAHGHDHGSGYGSHVIQHAGNLSLAGTSVYLNGVVNAQRDRILRIKGIAGFREKAGRPALLHAVQNKFYPLQWLPEWPDADHASRLVFIGRDLDLDSLNERFAALCID